MTPRDYMEAARVPPSLKSQEFGLWKISRRMPDDILEKSGLFVVGWSEYTLLSRVTEETLHQPIGEIVMEDSQRELKRHMPIWLEARGRVLVTGLGLGCVVRGLLASPRVEHVDVVEKDAGILRVVGAEFEGNPRVTLHHEDALEFWRPGEWDYAWHDLWTPGQGGDLQILHFRLVDRFRDRCPQQGAWMFPRFVKEACRRRGITEVIG